MKRKNLLSGLLAGALVLTSVVVPGTGKEVKAEERESEDTIINSIKSDGKEYATYHIHMVSDGESIETICTMYNSNLNILQDYNDLANITPGDKLIIPENNE